MSSFDSEIPGRAADAEYDPDVERDPATFGVGPVSEKGGTEAFASIEDREAEYSERTGKISQCEWTWLDCRVLAHPGQLVAEKDALSSNEIFEQRTRGIKNDAFKPERDLDRALEQENPEIVDLL